MSYHFPSKCHQHHLVSLTRKEFEELSKDEIIKKRIGYLNEIDLL